MRIEELTPEVAITFFVDINGEQLIFNSRIQEVLTKRRLVLADPVYQDEKIISFRGNNIHVNVLAVFPDDKPQLFEDVVVTPMRKSDNSLCYNLSCANPSKGYNRRNSFRCFVGISTSLQYKPGEDPVDVIIRDVSTNGFAITCSNNIELVEGQIIHVVLNDYIMQESENYSFHMYGIVVRIQDLGNGKVVYGCRLNNHVGGLENYIAKKERYSVRNKNSSTPRKR